MSSPPKDDEKPSTVTPAKRALAVSMSLVPGLLLHGSGNYALGRRRPALKLLALEGIGLGSLATGGAVLFLTGAARDWVAPAAALSVAGIGLFSVSWVLDMYSVLAPEGGFGAASNTVPWFQSAVGYAYVYDPKFDYRHFVVTELSAQQGRFGVEGSLWSSGYDANQRGRIAGLARIIGQTPSATPLVEPDGSALDARLALTEHRYPNEGFDITTVEWAFRGKLDLFHYDRAFAGSFAEFELGLGQQIIRWTSLTATSNEDLLLLRFGIGFYLGNQRPAGGSVKVYYDHRHDGYAGGLLIPGLGSGVPGHFGLEGEYFWDRTFGAGLLLEAGSAYVSALSMKVRAQ